jgi:hypothetical protein
MTNNRITDYDSIKLKSRAGPWGLTREETELRELASIERYFVRSDIEELKKTFDNILEE